MLDFLLALAILYAISVLPVTLLVYHAIDTGGFTAENTPPVEWLLAVALAALAFWIGLTWPYWLWFGTVEWGDKPL